MPKQNKTAEKTALEILAESKLRQEKQLNTMKMIFLPIFLILFIVYLLAMINPYMFIKYIY
ncbi:MAG: hypothetical protein IKO56_09970 [Alphaproteobacteria bacterium]|nr:hypothetical protein [Alphaproteobacteria bacterium]